MNYFGYGAMANPVIVTALLGRLPTSVGVFGSAPRITGWSLVIQNLEHLPNVAVTHDEATINPQALMGKVWGEDFRSYTIIPDPKGTVYGVIWQDLTPQERELICEWELIHWGWFKELSAVSVRATGLFTCGTECMGDGQGYDEATGVIKDKRPKLLIPEEMVAAKAREVRAEFLAR